MLQSSCIPRLHIFEFHDQSWFPALFRNALTEWLRTLWDESQAARVIAPILASALKKSGSERIVDLCSGATGPLIPISITLRSLGINIPVLATDKFPDPAIMEGLQARTEGRVTGSLESIDATALPRGLTGFRTLWNSFHHFRPPQAREILKDACHSRQPIAIFEFTERTVIKVLFSFPASFFSVYWSIRSMHPRRWEWWFFTWVIPVIPLIVGWDGLVSHLRSYTRAELAGLTEGLRDENYVWETGRVHTPRGGLDVSYLIGRPGS